LRGESIYDGKKDGRKGGRVTSFEKEIKETVKNG